MKIIDTRVSIEALEPGDTFFYEGSYYMKVDGFTVKENVVDLGDGKLAYFGTSEHEVLVMKVDATLTIRR